tara:strand:- start:639 stop:1610 length:972 start_codon:yes stop_codon:yes gene_type:complete
MKKSLGPFIVFFFFLVSVSSGQVENRNELADGKSLIQAYLSPLGNSLGSALNNGWYNTSKPHHLGGFDITFTANLVFVPEGAKKFNITESNSGYFTGGQTPTILGDKKGGNATYFALPNGPNPGGSSSVEMPSGLNTSLIPVPMLQAGVGLIKNTEIDIRFMPQIEMSGVKTGLFGAGIKHDILQWLPIVDKIPIDVSFQAGYTKLNSQLTLEDPNSNQKVDANLDVIATTFNIILSKKVAIFTAYGSLGYNSSKTVFNVNGEYNIAGMSLDVNELTDFEFENNNQIRANLGFRFQIAVLALQANYTFSEYPVATIGAGISIR